MGHYDDCYASDDFHEMTSEEKERYYPGFEKTLFQERCVRGLGTMFMDGFFMNGPRNSDIKSTKDIKLLL